MVILSSFHITLAVVIVVRYFMVSIFESYSISLYMLWIALFLVKGFFMEISINGKTLQISNSKTYKLPDDIFVKIFEGFAVIISPSNGNWIVLESQIQIDVFKLLMNGNSINQILDNYSDYIDDVHKVIEQIEGRSFEHRFIPSENGFSLRIYLTNNCNLRCHRCFVFASTAFENELSTKEIKNLIFKCDSFGCRKIILTGGEVILRKDFKEIVKYSHELGMYVQVLSNGTLWNHNQIEEMSHYIDEIQISIDGYDEQSNSKIRGYGVFEKALNTVNDFIKSGNVFVNIVVTPMYEDLEKNYSNYFRFANQLIKRYMNKKFLIYFQEELINGREFKANKRTNNKMKRLVHKLHEELYENSALTTFIMHHKNHQLHQNCGYGGLTIDSVGNVFSCGRIHELKSFGNIRFNNIESILNLRKTIRQSTSVENLSPCGKCELRYICGGGCRINNFPNAVNVAPKAIGKKPFVRTVKCEEKERIYRLMIDSIDFLLECNENEIV